MNSEAKNDSRWERAVPVYGFPVVTRAFLVLVALTLLALLLTGYRELAGLGPVSGMNDAFGWGIWKTFNVMVLTALGSGAFAVGIAAWVFRRKKLHALMRMALLTSFLAYACGLMLLGIDAGKPWNFYWIVFPWKWNMHSPLAEVAICMSIYAMIPLAVENLPPVLERLWYFDSRLRPGVEKAERRILAHRRVGRPRPGRYSAHRHHRRTVRSGYGIERGRTPRLSQSHKRSSDGTGSARNFVFRVATEAVLGLVET